MKQNLKLWVLRIVGLLIGMSIIFGLVWHVGVRRFFDILLSASPVWLALSMVIYAVGWLLRTWRLKRLADHSGGSIAAFDLFKINIAGYALNAILPAKLGDAAMICNLSVKGISFGRSAAITFQTRIMDMIALILLFVPSLWLTRRNTFPLWILVAFLISLCAVSVPIGVVILDRFKKVGKIFDWIDAHFDRPLAKMVVKKLKDAYEGYHDITSDRRLFLFSLLVSVLIWFMDVLSCYLIAVAVGSPIPLIAITFAICIGNVCKGAPTTPGSIGVYEGAIAMVLVLFGYPFEMAAVIGILDHLLKKAFNLILGFSSLANAGMSIPALYRKAREQCDSSPDKGLAPSENDDSLPAPSVSRP